MIKLSISEILNKIPKLETNAEKKAWLRKNNSTVLRRVLHHMYDKRAETLLPEGAPPYTPSAHPDSQGILYANIRKLRIFYKNGGYDHLSNTKRESLFIGMLESVDAGDAELMIRVKDQIPVEGLSAGLINKALDMNIRPIKNAKPAAEVPVTPPKEPVITNTNKGQKLRRLTEAEKLEIFRLYTEENITQGNIAKIFEVTKATVNRTIKKINTENKEEKV